MTLLFEASVILDFEGEEGLRLWEERLTPEQKVQLEADWKAFAVAVAELAKASCAAGIAMKRAWEGAHFA